MLDHTRSTLARQLLTTLYLIWHAVTSLVYLSQNVLQTLQRDEQLQKCVNSPARSLADTHHFLDPTH